MKITDYAILFMIIILVMITVYGFKDNMAFQYAINCEEANRVIDNAAIDALNKAYVIDKSTGEPNVDIDKLKIEFCNDLSLMITGEKTNINKIAGKIRAMIYVEKNGYFFMNSIGEWSEKKIFDEEEHEKHIMEIEKELEKSVSSEKYKILLPKNKGEIFSQTISDYSFVVIYEADSYIYDGVEYTSCIMAGSAIKTNEY